MLTKNYMYLQCGLELLSEGSDVRIVSGTVESIENVKVFGAFLLLRGISSGGEGDLRHMINDIGIYHREL